MSDGSTVTEPMIPYISIDTTKILGAHKKPYLTKAERAKFTCEITCLCTVGSTIWVGEASGKVSVVEVDTGKFLNIVLDHRGAAVIVMRTARGYVWAGFADGSLRVFNSSTIDLIFEKQFHKDCITDIALSQNCDTAYSSSLDSYVCYWNTSFFAIENPRVLGDCRGAVRSLVLFHDLLFSGGDDSKIIEWNTVSKERKHVLAAHSAPILVLTICNNFLWSGSEDGVVCIWSLSDLDGGSPECIHMITNPHEGPVTILKTVGLKVWSVSMGQVYIWNSSSFELEVHCRLSKEHHACLNVMETVSQAFCSKTWIAYKNTGDITIVQSDDVPPLPLQNLWLWGDVKDNKDKDQLIAQLLESQKSLTSEVLALRAQLATLKPQQCQKEPIDGFETTKHDETEKTTLLNAIPKAFFPASKEIIDNMTNLTSTRSNNENHGFSNIPFPIEGANYSDFTSHIPRYAVVDTHVLFERLIYLHEQVREIIGSSEVLYENNCLYLTDEKGRPPIPIGFITLAELTEKERIALINICGGSRPPFLIPALTPKNQAEICQFIESITSRLRGYRSIPSLVSSENRMLINDFSKSIYPLGKLTKKPQFFEAEPDEIGFSPLSFYLNKIICDVMIGARRIFQEKNSRLFNERADSIEGAFQGLKERKDAGQKQSSLSYGIKGTESNEGLVFFSPDVDVLSLKEQVLPLNFDGPQSNGGNDDRRNATLIQRINFLKRRLVECVTSHSSKQVKTCATNILTLTYTDEFSDIEKEMEELSAISFDLVRRLCRLVENLETELQEQKLSKSIFGAVDKSCRRSHTDDTPQQFPGLVSLFNRMQENNLVAHEFVIQYLLEVGGQIALQYGCLMDTLLQRQNPSAHSSISWGYESGRCNLQPSSLMDSLNEYSILVEKVHAVEAVFFADRT
ncbi:hypothetical protein MOQ_006303 [Trypanosoma cruzi marinkellei]|uniref:Uncharacterized protein n=1 Tax=Trypanosoma cruzi marinkellei TaxID=85056 RepID=K2NLZ7_TRYCR|nr:hypothetical protein MOQ_006303 [Trypanosoma cruzi marinkellei]